MTIFKAAAARWNEYPCGGGVELFKRNPGRAGYVGGATDQVSASAGSPNCNVVFRAPVALVTTGGAAAAFAFTFAAEIGFIYFHLEHVGTLDELPGDQHGIGGVREGYPVNDDLGL